MSTARRTLNIGVSEEDLTSGAVLRWFPTGVSLFHSAKSVEDARRLMAAYRSATEGTGRP